MDARFVEYFASRNVGSMLCVRVPYHDGTFAIILLQLYNSSVGRAWREDDMLLLQEASAQGTFHHSGTPNHFPGLPMDF